MSNGHTLGIILPQKLCYIDTFIFLLLQLLYSDSFFILLSFLVLILILLSLSFLSVLVPIEKVPVVMVVPTRPMKFYQQNIFATTVITNNGSISDYLYHNDVKNVE